MTVRVRTHTTARRRPRLWPGVLLVTLQWLCWVVLPKAIPSSQTGMIAAMGGLLLGVLFLLWWTFSGVAGRGERWGGTLLAIVAIALTPRILHESLATAGMGMLYFIYAVPWLCLGLLLWILVARGWRAGARRVALVGVILLASSGWALLRTEGVSAAGSHFAWRGSATAEERLLARANQLAGADSVDRSDLPSANETDLGRAAWPGYRGPSRDGVAHGVEISSDWDSNAPEELWRHPIGPGWSSFAVDGSRLYTQEQRGEQEVVSCYDAGTGRLLWRHADEARFWESQGGAGPRGTPATADGVVYTLGATGVLNALNDRNGERLWSRDLSADSAVEVPTWAFSSSPLVVDDLVLVAAAGRLAAYDRHTGEVRWLGDEGGVGYSSPHLTTLGGVRQVLFQNGDGVTAFEPASGAVLWQHLWEGYPIVQPARIDGSSVLVTSNESEGLRRLDVSRQSSEWAVEEVWTSRGLKPYFSDYVVHEGHAYGFDGSILSSIDLETGERRWKGGRYGHGQLVLLPASDLLLVVSEKGELVLVEATPEAHSEVARAPAIEGKTWNHPVVVGDRLFVRNGEEMAAFRLP